MLQSTTPFLSQTIWPRLVSRPFLSLPKVQNLLPVTFAYSLSSEAVVMRQLGRWKRLWRRSLTRSHKGTSMGHSRSCWNGTTSALQSEEITSKGTRVSCVYYKSAHTKKSGNLFNDPRCWRSRDELIRDVLLWIPTHGRAKAGRPARTYIQQLCEDTGCCPEDLPRAMNDREEWRERVRDIRAASTRWWWW